MNFKRNIFIISITLCFSSQFSLLLPMRLVGNFKRATLLPRTVKYLKAPMASRLFHGVYGPKVAELMDKVNTKKAHKCALISAGWGGTISLGLGTLLSAVTASPEFIPIAFIVAAKVSFYS